jgi:hypothetical protein
MPTYFIDPIGGDDANDGLSFANRWRTITDGPTAARVAPGDEIRFIESPAPTLIGNCTWPTGASARTITVPDGAVKLIDALAVNTGWTAAAHVTLNAASGNRVIGAAAVNFTVGTAFTTGKLAHKPLTMDLAGFRQVNVWFRTSLTLTAGTIFLDLCSDATGDVPIVSIPFADGTNAAWFAGLIAHTGSIGTINSIALRATADPGTNPIISINNLWASKAPGSADEITLATMVSKTAYTTSPPLRGTGTGDEPLLGVMGITSDTVVVLNRSGAQDNGVESSGRGYDGAAGTVATYAHQCFPYRELRIWAPREAGTEAAQTVWTGGWSATDMATRTGMTRYMLSSRTYSAGSAGEFAFHTFRNFVMNTSFGGNTLPGGNGCRVENCLLTSCSFAVNGFAQSGLSAADVCYSVGGGITLGGANQPNGSILENIYTYLVGLSYGGGRNFVRGITIRNSGGYALGLYGNPGNDSICINDMETLNNQSGGIFVSMGVSARLRNAKFGEASDIFFVSNGNDGLVSVESLGKIAGNDTLRHTYGRATRQTAVVDTQASSWRVQVTSSNAVARGPLRLPLGQFEITRGVTTSIAIRMRRDNTGLSMGLSYLPTEGLPGITTEQRALMTAAANTWETVTLTLSPTGSGTQIVSLDVIAWGGTTFNGYFEAITVT